MKKLSCSTSCAKMTLIAFNVIFWLSGCVILAVGVWLKVEPSVAKMTMLINVTTLTGDSFISAVAWVFIAVGIFVFLIGFCGCCGAVRESQLLLGVYMLCLVLVTGGELAGGVYTAVRREDIHHGIVTKGIDWIRREYQPPESTSRAFNYVMLEFECCGLNSYLDFEGSHFSGMNTTSSYGYVISNNYTIPKFCCKNTNKDASLAAEGNSDAADGEQCKEEAKKAYANRTISHADNFRAEGCVRKMADYAQSQLLVVVLAGCLIAAVEVFGFTAALCLCRSIGDD